MKRIYALIMLLICISLITSCEPKSLDTKEPLIFPDDSIVHLVESIKAGTKYTELPKEFHCNYSVVSKAEEDWFSREVALEYRLSDGGVLTLKLSGNPPEISFDDLLGLTTYVINEISIGEHKLEINDDGYFILPKGATFVNYKINLISKATTDDLTKLLAGMSEYEVLAVLGEDYVTKKMNGILVESVTYMLTDGTKVEISFEKHVELGDISAHIYSVICENGVKILAS